jgi:hypothetical protein
VAVRLGDPAFERPGAGGSPRTHQLRWPVLNVVVSSDGHAGGSELVRGTRAIFDRVVVDLPVATGMPVGAAEAAVLAHLDVLLIAVTARDDAIGAARCHLEELRLAAAQGVIDPGLDVRLVLTGDEGSATLDVNGALQMLGDAAALLVGSVVQLWGRSEPNLGFGPTLGVPSLDRSMAAIVAALECPLGADSELVGLPSHSPFAEPTFA